MFFGLPWYAIIAIISVAGGLFYAYKEKEMELEAKRMGSSREIQELRKIVHNLKSRVEDLEANAEEKRRHSASHKESNTLGDIEIDDEVDSGNSDTTNSSGIKNNLRN